jgi:hypothetical protein
MIVATVRARLGEGSIGPNNLPQRSQDAPSIFWPAGLGGSHFSGFGFQCLHLLNYFDLEFGKPLFFGASFVPKMLNFNLVLAGWGRQRGHWSSPDFPGVYSPVAVEIKPGALRCSPRKSQVNTR